MAEKKKKKKGGRAMMGYAGSGGAVSTAGRGAALKAAAMQEKHTLVAVGAAVALGMAKRQGWNLPHLPMLGPAASYGLAAWALAKYSKSRVAGHAATGLLSVAAYELASGGGQAGAPGVSGDDLAGGDELMGEL